MKYFRCKQGLNPIYSALSQQLTRRIEDKKNVTAYFIR